MLSGVEFSNFLFLTTLNEFSLCAQPRVQLIFPCFQKKNCFFLQSLMLKSITGNMGGTEFSHIFPPQYQEMQLPAATYCRCTAARRVRVVDTVTNLRLNRRTVSGAVERVQDWFDHL